jgi:hypothetical protein
MTTHLDKFIEIYIYLFLYGKETIQSKEKFKEPR